MRSKGDNSLDFNFALQGLFFLLGLITSGMLNVFINIPESFFKEIKLTDVFSVSIGVIQTLLAVLIAIHYTKKANIESNRDTKLVEVDLELTVQIISEHQSLMGNLELIFDSSLRPSFDESHRRKILSQFKSISMFFTLLNLNNQENYEKSQEIKKADELYKDLNKLVTGDKWRVNPQDIIYSPGEISQIHRISKNALTQVYKAKISLIKV